MSLAKPTRSTPRLEQSGQLGIRIREMTEHDLHEVVEIEELCGLSRWGWDAYHRELANGCRGLMLVATHLPGSHQREGFNLIGFVASRIIVQELHINNIAVRPNYRRSGIAGALLEAVKLEGLRLGATDSLLEVRALNFAAQGLYKRYGYTIAGRRPNYYTDPPEDAFVMRSVLRNRA